ncbi:MAG TPA: hypothetical protein VF746_22785 [Longimicrobium sp.]|jgi:hypothetical protein
MPSRNAGLSVGVLREALRAEVEAATLRQVARLVGMSPSGLQKFLDGAHPHGATRRRLERWHVLHGPGRLQAGLGGGRALAVLHALVQDLAPARHRAVMEQLLESMEQAYLSARLPRPEWLEELRDELARDARA